MKNITRNCQWFILHNYLLCPNIADCTVRYCCMELTVRHVNKQEYKIGREGKFNTSCCILILVINTECFNEIHGYSNIHNITKGHKLEAST
jgi:hypothetical protein